AWPEAFIAHRDRRGEVVEAVARHDSGWVASDARGVLDGSTGRPASFLGLPLAAYPPIWASSIEEAARFGPLAEYLVARHSAALARMGRPSDPDPEGQATLAAFRAETDRTIARLTEAIAPPPSSGPYRLAATALENDFRFLQLNDILSLAVCGGHSEPRLVGFLRGSSLGDEVVQAEVPEPFVLRLAPWIFEPGMIEETVPVRTIPDEAYPDQAALSDAITQAAVIGQAVRIKPFEE
ncbi:MAG: DUF3891 family protein, partial [bacterium]